MFSSTFKGLEFFPKFKDFHGLLKDPMNHDNISSLHWST